MLTINKIKSARITTVLTLLVIFAFSAGCGKKNKPEEEPPIETFDKQGMLTNYADHLILPNYQSYKSSVDSLVAAFNAFKVSGNVAAFQKVKLKFDAAYLAYQRTDMFEFGPAESLIFRMSSNIFPTDTVQIKSNISSGSYDLNNASNFDAKGLPALDYLFYGKNQAEGDIVNLFNLSSNRKQYVSDLLSEMSTKINAIISGWNSNYRNTFISSLGTDVGSSIGFLVNQLNYNLDYLKNSKIGIPLGKKTLGIPAPDKCEAYYGGQSVQYAMETLLLIESAYLGRSESGENGKGFDDYIEHLNLQHNGGSLHNAITNQFAVCKTKLGALSNPLSTQVVSNASQVDAAYIELVKLLVLLKTDMPSGLGVIITYQDGDGD